MARWSPLLMVAGLAVACRDEVPLTAADPTARRAARVAVVPLACVAERQAVRCESGSMATASSMAEASAVAWREMPAAPASAVIPAGPANAPGEPTTAAVRVFGPRGSGVTVSVSFTVYTSGVMNLQAFVTNGTGQSLATVDGTTRGPTGLRIGVVDGPTVIGPGDPVTPASPSGTGTFTQPGQPYWDIPLPGEVLRPGDQTVGFFGFAVPTNVQRFTFRLLLATDLVDESDAGMLQASAGYESFATGDFGGCGVKLDGSLWCWGRNDEGQLAIGRIDATASGAFSYSGTSVALGDAHVCVSDVGTGRLSCAGSGSEGQTGFGFAGGYAVLFSSIDNRPTFRDLVGGGGNTCGVNLSTNVPSCWGDGRFGQLGTVVDESATPRDVSLPAGATLRQFVVGREGTICALATDNRAFCWGRNEAGQVGSGVSGGDVLARTEVTGGRLWQALAVGARHTCGIEAGTGDTYCWGAGDFGQVGSVTSVLATPTRVANVPAATAITAGRDFTCVAAGANGVWCWGRNDDGQVGVGNRTLLQPPAAVDVGAGTWTQVVAGDRHVCAARSAPGVIRCWGDNRRRQVSGTNAVSEVPSPTDAGTLEVDERLGPASANASCITLEQTAGRVEVRCSGSDAGQHTGANGVRPVQLAPMGILSGIRWRSVGVGNGHACALNVNGAVYCWGRGQSGQLGDGLGLSSAQPVRIQGVLGDTVFRLLAVGGDHACAVLVSSDQLYCWGRNDFGQLGTGTRTAALIPTLVPNARFLGDVWAGRYNTCAAGELGLACWGANGAGQLGNGTNSDQLTVVSVLPNVSVGAVAIGGSDDPGTGFICAVADGELRCAGANDAGQGGRGSTGASSNTFLRATALATVPTNGVLRLAAGRAHACASDLFETYCWGATDDGQSTLVRREPLLVPERVDFFSEASALVASGDRTCSLRFGRWACAGGRNRFGELGVGSTVPRQGGFVP
jgi:alpha-tubulin suppressor-like RCC1 family protein